MRLSTRTGVLVTLFLTATLGGVVLLAGCMVAPGQSGITQIAPVLSPTPSTTQATITSTVTAPGRPAGRKTPVLEATSRILLPEVFGPPAPPPTETPTPVPTATPIPPTPTPTVPWPDALSGPSYSKLGLHVQWNNSQDIMEFTRRMKPAVIKAIDDLGFVAEVRAASPETVIVARLTHQGQPTEGDPEAMARAFVQANLAIYQQHPAVDYWEGYNEPDVQGRMDWYARFEAERVRAMAQYGLRTAVGSFSAGVPEYEAFRQFLPAIRAALQHDGVLSLHEYDAPTLDRAIGGGIPGLPGQPDRGPLALRYRFWYDQVLKPAGLVIPLIITEAGVDGLITNRTGPTDARGWRDFATFWREQYGEGDPLDYYLRQLDWYDRQLQQDDYVIGWALFTTGAIGPQWESYDVTEYLRQIAAAIIVPQAR